jgi:uncharacterized protein
MNPDFSDIFIIPVNSNYLVYAPLKGISALINRRGVSELKKLLHSASGNPENKESKLHELARELIHSPEQVPARKTGSLNPEFLGIIPTRSCNGACNYCDFGADKASGAKMSYDLAAKAVDWYAEIVRSQQRNMLDIHFFGGEPMVARDVIEVVVHRARLVAMKHDLIPYFEISTNGQFIAADARFLGVYFNKVVLSLDGFQEIHDKHRPLKGNRGSYENAVETAKIIGSSNAELCIRCCISRLNVLRMEEITAWFCKNLRLSTINFEVLCATSQTKAAGLFPPDPVDFAVHFHRSRKIALDYGIEVVYASDITDRPGVSSCPVGKDTAIVSPDGRISNCYLLPERWKNAGLDLDFGQVGKNGRVQLEETKISAIRGMVENKPRCAGCFCQWSCSGGCHVGITPPGCSVNYDDFCRQTRLISAFTLLVNLELDGLPDGLMQSPESLVKINSQASDRLETYPV